MFQFATGYLGYTPEVAMHTPMPQILLALDGRIEWLRKTNGVEDEKPANPAEKLKAMMAAKGTVKHVNKR
jgi:hypothetical protein